MIFKGFEPVYNSQSRILILGSFPSVSSRANDFYYANPQNRFWRTLETIFNKPIDKDVYSKIKFLHQHNIALWDIVASCTVVGSSDSTIKPVEIANLNMIIDSANIDKILCNGKKAYYLTNKYYRDLHIPIIYLPSTSPANTRFDINLWTRELIY